MEVRRHGCVPVVGATGSCVGKASDISGTVYDPLCRYTLCTTRVGNGDSSILAW